MPSSLEKKKSLDASVDCERKMRLPSWRKIPLTFSPVVHGGQMFLMEDGLVCEFLGIVAGTDDTNTVAFWGRIFEPAARQCERCTRGVCANRTLHRQRYVDRDKVFIRTRDEG